MPPSYRIRIERRALKALGGLPKRQRTSIRKAIDSLGENPLAPTLESEGETRSDEPALSATLSLSKGEGG